MASSLPGCVWLSEPRPWWTGPGSTSGSLAVQRPSACWCGSAGRPASRADVASAPRLRVSQGGARSLAGTFTRHSRLLRTLSARTGFRVQNAPYSSVTLSQRVTSHCSRPPGRKCLAPGQTRGTRCGRRVETPRLGLVPAARAHRRTSGSLPIAAEPASPPAPAPCSGRCLFSLRLRPPLRSGQKHRRPIRRITNTSMFRSATRASPSSCQGATQPVRLRFNTWPPLCLRAGFVGELRWIQQVPVTSHPQHEVRG